MVKRPTILIISGATASGKTGLSIQCAKEFNGEIISADSQQVYKELNIGTAKATKEEMQDIKHYLIDIKEPTEFYDAFNFKTDCENAIDNILKQGKLPIICGGTGLFINTILFNYDFDKQKKQEPKYNIVLIVLNCDRAKLYDRINQRVGMMLEAGLLDEIKNLMQKYPLKNDGTREAQVYSAMDYKDFVPYLSGNDTLEKCIEKCKQMTRNYAKRQLTWFRNQWHDAIWLETGEDTKNIEIIKNLLKETKNGV